MKKIVRAKMVCNAKQPTASPENGGGGLIRLNPVISGSKENEEFFKYTPSGDLTLSTINQTAFDQFELGQSYFVDIIPAT